MQKLSPLKCGVSSHEPRKLIFHFAIMQSMEYLSIFESFNLGLFCTFVLWSTRLKKYFLVLVFYWTLYNILTSSAL